MTSRLIIAVTGGDLTGNTGQLASPLYPRQYPHNSENQWTIIVDIGKKVKIGIETSFFQIQGLGAERASAFLIQGGLGFKIKI